MNNEDQQRMADAFYDSVGHGKQAIAEFAEAVNAAARMNPQPRIFPRLRYEEDGQGGYNAMAFMTRIAHYKEFSNGCELTFYLNGSTPTRRVENAALACAQIEAAYEAFRNLITVTPEEYEAGLHLSREKV